jgi:hypothetical protein
MHVKIQHCTSKPCCANNDFNASIRKFDHITVISSAAKETAVSAQTFVVHVVQGLYSIEFYHNIDRRQSSCSLLYMSNIMPLQPIMAPDILCCAQHLPGSPHNVKVRPSNPCATLSVLSTATSIWTAGVAGTIEIVTKDLYGNVLDTWDNNWHVFMTSSIPAVVKVFLRERIRGGARLRTLASTSVLYQSHICCAGMNHWKFATRATIASKYNIQAVLLGSSPGLMATAYSRPNGSVLSNFQVISHDDVQQSLKLGPRPQLYVVYSGYFFATRSGTYTFRLLKHSSLNETIRMTIDGSALFEITNGTTCRLASAGYCHVSATCVLESPGNMYAVGVEYIREDSSVLSGNFSLAFRYEDSSFLDMMAYILPAIGSKSDALSILVSPSVPRAASSLASGNCLTLATAGMACQFTMSTRDEFGSPSDAYSNFSILCTSFVDPAQVLSNVLSADGSTLKVSYVPSIAGVHTLSLFYQKSILQWTLLVMPAPSADAQQSFVRGSALTLATAGSQTKFTIFALDQYGNLIESANNIAVIVESDDGKEHHALSIESHRALNSAVFKELTSSYRITASGRYRISVAALDSGLSISMRSKIAMRETDAPAEYLTITDDVSLQSYHKLSKDL